MMMKSTFLLFTVVSLFFLFSPCYSQQPVYLHCGKLITAENENVFFDKTIVVFEGRIVSVEEGYIQPEDGSMIIDLKDKTVLPGLIDMHVHIESQSSPRNYEDRFRLNEADIALRATVYCMRTLEAGFTSVRDLGGSGVNVSLKNAINAGYIQGPRIFTSEKSLSTTGGHGDPSNGVRKDLMSDPGEKEGVMNGPEDAFKAVRQRYKNGADVIKITATGGVLSVAKDGSGPQFTLEEIQAVVQAANDYGMVTAAHAHGEEGMRRAVLAGIHSIEHGTMMSDEIMDLMIERGTYFVPTISAGKFVAEKAKEPGYFPAIIVPKALEIGPKIQETFARAYRKGVKIAFGTDTGVSPHGDNAREFIYMTEAGMKPIEAIRTATYYAADLLGMKNMLGTIAPGKWADIIAVDDNPIDNIETLLKVCFVMKNGEVIKK
ncbi:MAG TPA: amidohydrolase family protein [Saprospiraceae bacterium]|nr:amidohydrolase family protein [Saprospiraceae bacterium]